MNELFRSTAAETEAASGESGGAPSRPEPEELDLRALAKLIELAADENEATATARVLASPPGPSAAVGSLIAWLAASVDAKHAVSVGAGGGPLGLSLLRGMDDGGILTSIVPDDQQHSLQRTAFNDAGVSNQVRAIMGSADEVLPRLSDHAYDVITWSAGAAQPREIREHADRLLRPGGVLMLLEIARDTSPEERGRRTLVRDLIEDPRWDVTVLPIDGGVALARHA